MNHVVLGLFSSDPCLELCLPKHLLEFGPPEIYLYVGLRISGGELIIEVKRMKLIK